MRVQGFRGGQSSFRLEPPTRYGRVYRSRAGAPSLHQRAIAAGRLTDKSAERGTGFLRVDKRPDMEKLPDAPDRRDHARRAEVVRSVIEEIVHNGVPVLTLKDIENSLQVSSDAAARIVDRLVSAGLLVQAREGTWVKVSP